MMISIRKVLSHWDRRLEETLTGGVSADDILSETWVELLRRERSDSPKPLANVPIADARTVARHKAIDAIRHARKGLRGTEFRPEFGVVSADSPAVNQDNETGQAVIEMVAGDADTEADALTAHDWDTIWQIANELLEQERLDEVDLYILREIAREWSKRVEIAGMLYEEGLTRRRLAPQAIGQRFKKTVTKLAMDPRFPLERPLTVRRDRREPC